MNLPRLAVRNPVAVNLLMWLIIVAGLYCWFDLIREFFPNVEAEQVIITVAYPGATPEEVEKSITRLIEREIEDVDEVERVESSVFEGLTLIVAEMEEGANRDRVLNDLRGELDKVKPDLPDGAEEPEITEARPQIPVVALVVHGNVPERTLHEAVLDLEEDLLDLEDVSEVLVTGFRAREILVEILPERLEAEGLTFAEVGTVIAASNLDLPGGQLKGEVTNIRVRTMGEEQVALELEDIVIRRRVDGTLIRLSDVAVVREGFEDKVELGRHWASDPEGEDSEAPEASDPSGGSGYRAASLTVFKTPEQDAIKIADMVKAFAAERPTMAGGALDVTVTTDLSRFIKQRLELMTRNARIGLILVLLTLALFLELRVAFWVAVGLPVAFLGTFLLMNVFGATINLISLFGLIVVLGLIVDDAIIIGENVFTKLRSGVPALEAAEKGATEVGLPVLAAVITTCVAFVPLAFIEGRIGNFLGVLPVVVICALTVSLVEAFVILPAHLAHQKAPGPAPTGGFRLFARRFGEAKHWIFEAFLPRRLERSLRFMLRWRYVTAAGALATLFVAVGLVRGGIVPFVLLQEVDAETITGKIEMAAGTPEDETLRMLGILEQAARDQPEVATVFTVLGSSFDDRGRVVAPDPATVGQVVLELHPAEWRQARGYSKSPDLLARLRRETANLPGVRRLSWKGRSGGPSGADIEVLVRGDELDMVQPAVAHVEDTLGGFEGVDEIFDDLEVGKIEARLELLPTGRLLGLTTRDLAVQIRYALFGIEAQDLQIGDEEVTVRALLPESTRRNLADLQQLRIATPSGGRVPLEEVASVSTARGYASLARVDGKRAVTITAEVDEERANIADVTEALNKELVDLGTLFPGVSYTFEGQKKETNESLGSLAIGFPAALLAIFAVIAVIFRSYTQPIIVMAAIPFSLVGAIVGHWIMGYPFTILSMIGAVALSGIVVNDGLILVDFANRARRGGERATEAVIHASKARLRPILLTSLTTIVGLAPLMLETSFQAQFLIPMAVSIVFGLAFATGLTLILLPAFYVIFEDARSLLRWAWTGTYVRDLPYDPGVTHAAGRGA
ncbi:MAG: efflux RND transporter permease subunit [Planctomycetota bacterium]|jgi:multidrug efflux pump subunit AcrB